ncbi:MAG TPA: MFS transporter [Quisquiliibacterium sp.]|nr:MFS transporter [Quisquiliibacterium sp.]
MTEATPQRHASERAASAAFLFGNFVIGVGVMIVPGMLNQLADSLAVSVPTAGQLLGLAALVMCIGAPLTAAFTSHIDRRRLLIFAMAIYCVGHAACALAADYAMLAVLRPISVLGAAIFTPQAAATIGLLVPPERRGRALTTIFLGWSLASVAAMPLGSLIAGHLHWRGGFVLVAVLSALALAWIARVVPPGLTVPKLSPASWLEVARSRRLTMLLAATLVMASGQFILLAYIAPSLRESTGASPTVMAAFMAVNGVFGVIGNTRLMRRIGRTGADRAASEAILSMLVGLLLWSLAASLALPWPVIVLSMACWGFGAFASNSAQQARLAGSAPALTSASIALNSAGMYAGQTIGAGLGGLVIAASGYTMLGWFAAAVVAMGLYLSVRADRQASR